MGITIKSDYVKQVFDNITHGQHLTETNFAAYLNQFDKWALALDKASCRSGKLKECQTKFIKRRDGYLSRDSEHNEIQAAERRLHIDFDKLMRDVSPSFNGTAGARIRDLTSGLMKVAALDDPGVSQQEGLTLEQFRHIVARYALPDSVAKK